MISLLITIISLDCSYIPGLVSYELSSYMQALTRSLPFNVAALLGRLVFILLRVFNMTVDL